MSLEAHFAAKRLAEEKLMRFDKLALQLRYHHCLGPIRDGHTLGGLSSEDIALEADDKAHVLKRLGRAQVANLRQLCSTYVFLQARNFLQPAHCADKIWRADFFSGRVLDAL